MKKFFFIFLCTTYTVVSAQNDRVTDDNNVNWLQTFATVRINQSFDWVADVQWRRTQGLSERQQLLLRSALQYRFNNQGSLAAGYAWIETYPYGDFPIAANGTFPERRIHQQVLIKQSLNKLSISQRFRTEQRWLGRIAPNSSGKVEDWVFSHRFRYHLRLQRQLTDSSRIPFYVSVADEVFVNAGKNVGVNIFDQNRLQLLFGIKLKAQLGIELGYIKQTVQQGRRTASGNTVIQNNDGATLALLVQL